MIRTRGPESRSEIAFAKSPAASLRTPGSGLLQNRSQTNKTPPIGMNLFKR